MSGLVARKPPLRVRDLGFRNDVAQVDHVSGELWYFDLNVLKIYDPRTGKHRQQHVFSNHLIGRSIHFPRFGGVIVSLENGGAIQYSRCGAGPYEPILTLASPGSWITPWGIVNVGDHVLAGEYSLDGVGKANLHRLSITDEGKVETRQIATFAGYRHIHLVRQDGYTGKIYVSVGDDHKDVFVSNAEGNFAPLSPRVDGVMSMAFWHDRMLLGTDLIDRNFFLALDGVEADMICLPPGMEDMMIYDLLPVGDRCLATVRLSFDPARKVRRPGGVVLLDMAAGSVAPVSFGDAFYFTAPMDGKIYTSRTGKTVEIAIQ